MQDQLYLTRTITPSTRACKLVVNKRFNTISRVLLPVHFSLGVYICYYTGWKERSIFREKSDLEVRAAGSGGAGKQCKVSMQWCLCIGGTERIISGVKIQVGVK